MIHFIIYYRLAVFTTSYAWIREICMYQVPTMYFFELRTTDNDAMSGFMRVRNFAGILPLIGSADCDEN